MTYLLGNHNVVKFGTLRIWADRGLIHIEDSENDEYKAVSVREMLYRVNGLNEMIARSSDRGHSKNEYKGNYAEERLRYMRFVEEMIPVLRKAQEQGTPDEAMRTGRTLKNDKPVQVFFAADDIPTFQL